MKMFDLHCDTPFRMYRESLGFDSSGLDTNLSGLLGFDEAVQISAVWSDYRKTGQENYSEFFKIRENLLNEISKQEHSDKCLLCTSENELMSEKRVKLILAVEGGSLLCGDISRLNVLYSHGVRVLTLVWRGENEIGGGHDTNTGLTDFGKQVVSECEALGIVPDVSHMSEKSFWDTISCAELPVIASHSNSAHICSHSRNLTDTQFRTIASFGGLVGANLHPPFLSQKFERTRVSPDEYFAALCCHIEHFLSLGGEKCLCLGGDRDGIDRVEGYTPVKCADKIYEELLKRNIGEKIIKDIFFGNAMRFFRGRLPSQGRKTK